MTTRLRVANSLGSSLGDPIRFIAQIRPAAESVKRKYLDELCGSTRDTHFLLGTVYLYNTWAVIGVYWPPLEIQQALLF